jgi:hypothetical protein
MRKSILYSPFCVTAKVIKLVGLKNGGRLSPTNLITFAGTQNGEYTDLLKYGRSYFSPLKIMFINNIIVINI